MSQEAAVARNDPSTTRDVHLAIGELTRQLHDTLNELGYADQLRGTVDKLPDARSRLSYISRLTGEAAEKVLNRVDAAKTVHAELVTETDLISGMLRADPVKAVASGAVLNYIDCVNKGNKAIDQHLTDIMMAQDFHDLTGQVIAKVVTLATTIEDQLVQLLIQTAPPEHAGTLQRTVPPVGPLDGPVVNPEGRNDVVTDQSQVDDLLASLGF